MAKEIKFNIKLNIDGKNVVVQAITDNVGNMNAELARTDAGQVGKESADGLCRHRGGDW